MLLAFGIRAAHCPLPFNPSFLCRNIEPWLLVPTNLRTKVTKSNSSNISFLSRNYPCTASSSLITPLSHQFATDMSTLTTPSILPDVPVKHADFIPYLQSNLEKPLSQLLEPYKEYDAKLREVFAQEPNHPALNDPYINVVPVFGGHEKDLKIRARDLDVETIEEKERYVMSLDQAERRPNGSPAIVGDIKDFQQNFALFCESSLVDMDWSNVVAAG